MTRTAQEIAKRLRSEFGIVAYPSTFQSTRAKKVREKWSWLMRTSDDTYIGSHMASSCLLRCKSWGMRTVDLAHKDIVPKMDMDEKKRYARYLDSLSACRVPKPRRAKQGKKRRGKKTHKS